jgi:CRP/FNR family transcriptional regulator, anaerobic regulatory protein
MFETLYAYLSQRMPLTRQQFEPIENLFTPRSMAKGELLLREGEVAKYGAFVCKGCLRSYVVDDKGKEHIVQFAPENWWLSDIESMLTKKPSIYFMDAIEATEVLLADMPSFQKMLDQLPGFAEAFRLGQQKHTTAKDKRIISSLTADAEEKYSQFLNTYPSIAQRTPLHMIASYLGMSPETLSRVRKKWSVKK